MPPNSDNAMARFLFAILKQKNLKDIDWNKVAQDPVLLQPISNGHAARMRYSRFRATVMGHEPQKRSRHGEKSRVSKSSKREGSSKEDVIVKSESGVSLYSLTAYSPASLASPDSDDFNTRFLNPRADKIISVRPCALEKRKGRDAENAIPYVMDGNSDLFTDTGSLAHSPAFSAFEAAYDLSNYDNTSTDLRSLDLCDMSDLQSLADGVQEWDDRCHDPQLY